MIKLYGVAWDGLKVLNFSDVLGDLIEQIANDWWIYDNYMIEFSDTGETIGFTKKYAKFLQNTKILS